LDPGYGQRFGPVAGTIGAELMRSLVIRID
jgi:hypothetical protein